MPLTTLPKNSIERVPVFYNYLSQGTKASTRATTLPTFNIMGKIKESPLSSKMFVSSSFQTTTPQIPQLFPVETTQPLFKTTTPSVPSMLLPPPSTFPSLIFPFGSGTGAGKGFFKKRKRRENLLDMLTTSKKVTKRLGG